MIKNIAEISSFFSSREPIVRGRQPIFSTRLKSTQIESDHAISSHFVAIRAIPHFANRHNVVTMVHPIRF
jgi:hypothetical protein